MSKVFDLYTGSKHTIGMQLTDGYMYSLMENAKYFLALSVILSSFFVTGAHAATVVPDCESLPQTQICNVNNSGSCALQCRASVPAYQGIRTGTYNYYALSCPQGYKLASQRYYTRSPSATTIKPVSVADEYLKFTQNYSCQINRNNVCKAVSQAYPAGNSQAITTTTGEQLLMDLPSASTNTTICTNYTTICTAYSQTWSAGVIANYTTYSCCPAGTGCFGPHRPWYSPLGQACDGAGDWMYGPGCPSWTNPSQCQYTTSNSNQYSIPNYSTQPGWVQGPCTSSYQQCTATATTYAVCGFVHECVEPVTPNSAYSSPPIEGNCIYTGVQWKGSGAIAPPSTCASGSVCPPSVTPKTLDSDTAAPEWQ